jgi:hypothetical protein
VVEIIWYLDAWCSSADGQLTSTSSSGVSTVVDQRIYAICFPSYLGFSHAGEVEYIQDKYLQTKYFDDRNTDNPLGVKFRQKLRSLYPASLHPTPLDELQTDFAVATTNTSKIKKLTDKSRSLWQSQSTATPNHYPVGLNVPDLEKGWVMKASIHVHVVFKPSGPDTPKMVLEDFVFSPWDDNDKKSRGKKTTKKKWFMLDAAAQQPSTLVAGDERIVFPLTGEPIFSPTSLASIVAQQTWNDPTYVPQAATPLQKPRTIVGSATIPSSPTYPLTLSQILPFGAQASGAINLPDSSNEDYFVHSLRTSYVPIMPSVVVSSASAPWIGTVMNDSDLTDWFFNLFPDNNKTTLEISGVGVNLSSFSLQVSPFMGRNVTLNFTSRSDAISKAFSIDSSNLGGIVDAKGLVKKRCILILALESMTGTANITLAELYQLMDFTPPAWVSILDVPFKFIPATDKMRHSETNVNAIWFSPASNYNICMRLSLTDATQAGSAGTLFFQILPGCSFGTMDVVATKTTTYKEQHDPDAAAPGDTAGFKFTNAALAFHTTMSLLANNGSSSQQWDAYIVAREDSILVLMQWNNPSDAIDKFLTWIEPRLGLSGIFDRFKNILINAESTAGL